MRVAKLIESMCENNDQFWKWTHDMSVILRSCSHLSIWIRLMYLSIVKFSTLWTHCYYLFILQQDQLPSKTNPHLNGATVDVSLLIFNSDHLLNKLLKRMSVNVYCNEAMCLYLCGNTDYWIQSWFFIIFLFTLKSYCWVPTCLAF